MNSDRLTRRILMVMLPLVLVGTAGGQPEPCPIEDIVMYGINNDAPIQLKRFTFYTEATINVGEVVDQDGNTLGSVEAFSYIPQGPEKGFYGAWNLNDDFKRSKLIKLDVLTGETWTYGNEIGFGYIVGMVPIMDSTTSKWYMLASSRGYVGGAPPRRNNLVLIDPATGIGMQMAQLDNVESFQGLALTKNATTYYDAVQMQWVIDGTLYGVTGQGNGALYELRPDGDTQAEREIEIAQHGYTKVEALEFVFGKDTPAVEVPGVPATWTENGALFAYSDTVDTFLVFDPVSGAVVEYDPPFLTGPSITDIEGLAFFHVQSDPFNAVLFNCFD